jgi:hypothetical protein
MKVTEKEMKVVKVMENLMDKINLILLVTLILTVIAMGLTVIVMTAPVWGTLLMIAMIWMGLETLSQRLRLVSRTKILILAVTPAKMKRAREWLKEVM